MSVASKTLAEINLEAEKALYERLGVADTVRYLTQFQPRGGNYTSERDSSLGGLSVEELVRMLPQTPKE